jgi:hypothetical protein
MVGKDMRRLFLLVVLASVFLALAAGMSFATPVITFNSFNSSNYTYTYDVTLSAGDAFSQLAIATAGLIEPESGPYWEYATKPSGWYGQTTWGPPDGAQWTGGLIDSPGTYTFTWKVLNSRPTDTAIANSAEIWSGTQSYGAQAVRVPTAVPEPGTLVAFSFLAAALVPRMRKRAV